MQFTKHHRFNTQCHSGFYVSCDKPHFECIYIPALLSCLVNELPLVALYTSIRQQSEKINHKFVEKKIKTKVYIQFEQYYVSRVMRKQDFHLCENKGADQLLSNCEVFATQIVHFLSFLTPKVQATGHLL